MGTTSKSPKRVLLVARGVARRCVPAYSHRCSPKKFTQHQLFACLVLKEFLKLDYRGTECLLADSPTLRAVADLPTAPDFTTLQKATRRCLKLTSVRWMLAASLAKEQRMRVR